MISADPPPNHLAARRQALRRLAGTLAVAGVPAAAADALRVRYPRQDSVETYPVRVLALALAKTGRPFSLESLSYGMSQGRALRQLAEGRDLDVVWSITSEERERDLLPVRIPIDKGLYGWRLLLINQSELGRFEKVRSLDDLKSLRAGQGHDWPDTGLLRREPLQRGAEDMPQPPDLAAPAAGHDENHPLLRCYVVAAAEACGIAAIGTALQHGMADEAHAYPRRLEERCLEGQ